MKVEVDMERGAVVIAVSLTEATTCANAIEDFTAGKATERTKEILGGLVEALRLRPPTHVEREIEL